MYKHTEQSGGADFAAKLRKNSILNSVSEHTGGGKTYFVSQNGNDGNDGLTRETAVDGIAAVAKLPLEYGDSVLFECGGVFRTAEPLRLIDGVYYGNYGTGKKPEILGSLADYADADIWSCTGDGIWCADIGNSPAGNVVFNFDSMCGERKHFPEDLRENGDFYHDTESGKLFMVCRQGNPAEVYENIEISTAMDLMIAHDAVLIAHDITVDGLCFKYATFGPFLFSNVDNITVKNCVMGWHGGKVFSVRDDMVVRYGNAIEFWYRCNNVTVSDCWIYEVFDAAMTFQGNGDDNPIFTDITFKGNLIEYCCMNIEFWAEKGQSDKPPHISGVNYDNNIIRFGGYGWGGVQRPDKEDQAMLLGWNNKYEDLSDFTVQNNILDCADCPFIYMASPKEQAGLRVKNNEYYQKKTTGLHEFTEVIKGSGLYADNQQDFEYAIGQFDESPEKILWID